MKKFSIIFTKASTKLCLSLHYNADNSYFFVNGKEIIRFKAGNKNVNFLSRFCLGSIYNGFSVSESKNYPFMISLNKCIESCNILSPKICVPKETKDINVKAFNMITNENDAKAMTEHISCDSKCKLNS